MVAESSNPDDDQVEIVTDVVDLHKPSAPPPHILVNYDDNPTRLFKLLEARDWEGVLQHISEYPSEVYVWIFRNDSDGSIFWRLLPLHASIIFRAPDEVITELLDIYPLGGSRKDDQGMLPLHLAIKMRLSDALIDELIKCYPKGLIVKDSKGRIPLELLCTPKSNGLPMNPPPESTYGCRLYPGCEDHPVDDMLDDIDYSASLNSLGSTRRPSSIFLYLDVIVSRERSRIKREMKESVEDTIKHQQDDFNARKIGLKKQATGEMHALKKSCMAELDALKTSHNEKIKQTVVLKSIESNTIVSGMKLAHWKQLEVIDQEMKSVQENYERELVNKRKEKNKLHGEQTERIKEKVNEMKTLQETHVKELRNKVVEMNKFKTTQIEDFRQRCDEMVKVKESFYKDLQDKDNMIRTLQASHAKEIAAMKAESDEVQQELKTLRSSVQQRLQGIFEAFGDQ